MPKIIKCSIRKRVSVSGFTDERSFEKAAAYICKKIASQSFQSGADAQQFIDKLTLNLCIDDVELVTETPLEQAQAKMYEAFGARKSKKRVALAEEALRICADCADAYVLLAEESDQLSERLELYKNGVAAGRRALGPEQAENYAGRFWTDLTTRPLLRALHGYGLCLWNSHKKEAALSVFREILQLNPEDNLGVRNDYCPALIQSGEFAEASKLLEKCRDEPTAAMKYSRAMLLFRTAPETKVAKDAIIDAVLFNPMVLAALFNLISITEDDEPRNVSFEPQSLAEAQRYAYFWGAYWFLPTKGDLAETAPMAWVLATLREGAKLKKLRQIFPGLNTP